MPRTRLADIQPIISRIGGSAVPLTNSGYVRPRERRITNFHPLGGGESWGVPSNSLANLERALVERVFTVSGVEGGQVLPPQPEPKVLNRLLMRFTARFLRNTQRVVPLSTEQFVEKYTGRKRRTYELAAASLELRPLVRSDAFVQSFIKDEKTNLTRKVDPCPRIIQPRSARFNICIGRHLKPMEKEVFRGLARTFHETTVMKGLNAVERGRELARKWRRFRHPVAISLDASRFDQHCSRHLLNWEQRIEERLTTDPTELRRFNRMRSRNVGFVRNAEGGYRYTLVGGRMSGDMDTAMGNCLSMCGMMWSFMDSVGIRKYSFANDGDDGVLFVEEEHEELVLREYAGYFLRLGFTMKLEGVARELEHIEFCQSRPVFDGVEWRMVRDPVVSLGKDSLTVKSVGSVEQLVAARSAVGWCGMSLAGDMPVLGVYYRTMIHGDRPEEVPETGMQFLAARLEPRWGSPTAAARASFHKAFDLSPDQQLAIEAEIVNTECRILTTAVGVDHFSTLNKTLLNYTLYCQHS